MDGVVDLPSKQLRLLNGQLPVPIYCNDFVPFISMATSSFDPGEQQRQGGSRLFFQCLVPPIRRAVI